MKHLIIYCHPNPRSFNHGILETLTGELRHRGQEVRLRDLYQLGFEPVLKACDFELLEKCQVAQDVMLEQDHIRWAEIITLIYPVWWSGMPALLKGYLDRVFTLGFAYSFSEKGPVGLLKGKKVFLISTTGAADEMNETSGILKAMAQTIDFPLQMCGFELLGHKYFGGVPSLSEEARAKMLLEVKAIAEKLS